MTLSSHESHIDLVAGPYSVALTTVMPDGQPQTTVVWWDYDGECVLISTTLERRRAGTCSLIPR